MTKTDVLPPLGTEISFADGRRRVRGWIAEHGERPVALYHQPHNVAWPPPAVKVLQRQAPLRGFDVICLQREDGTPWIDLRVPAHVTAALEVKAEQDGTSVEEAFHAMLQRALDELPEA